MATITQKDIDEAVAKARAEEQAASEKKIADALAAAKAQAAEQAGATAPETAQAQADQAKAPNDLVAAIAGAMITATTMSQAPARATVGMDKTRPGGYYFHQGQVVDANGRVIADAPKADKKAARDLWAASQGFTPQEDEE